MSITAGFLCALALGIAYKGGKENDSNYLWYACIPTIASALILLNL